MKNFKKLLGFVVVFMVAMVAFCSVSFAATVGDTLTSPESGWQRIDDIDNKIVYIGAWSKYTTATNCWESTYATTDLSTDKLKFNFFGTKLRIISYIGDIGCQSSVKIKIDGVEEIFTTNGTPTSMALVYEKVNLENSIHVVEIFMQDNTGRFHFDAIDIDSAGYLVDCYQPKNLTATSVNLNVDLTWNAVEGATKYNVKRATTAGGPYTTIGTSTTNTYSDTTVTNGTKYYYVVSAIVNGTESENSNEASATPTAPVIGNSGILEITMTNGQIKEYDLTATELDAFLTWYDNRSNGTGKSYYVFTKKSNIKPFLSRKEYIAFDKISSFEVKEYAE